MAIMIVHNLLEPFNFEQFAKSSQSQKSKKFQNSKFVVFVLSRKTVILIKKELEGNNSYEIKDERALDVMNCNLPQIIDHCVSFFILVFL